MGRQQVGAVREQEQGQDPEDDRGAPQAAHASPPSVRPESGSSSAVAWPAAGPAVDSAATPPLGAGTPAPPGPAAWPSAGSANGSAAAVRTRRAPSDGTTDTAMR